MNIWRRSEEIFNTPLAGNTRPQDTLWGLTPEILEHRIKFSQTQEEMITRASELITDYMVAMQHTHARILETWAPDTGCGLPTAKSAVTAASDKQQRQSK